jgi:hypothetical protein
VSDHAPLRVGVHRLRDAERRAMHSAHHAKPESVPGRERRLRVPGANSGWPCPGWPGPGRRRLMPAA